MWDEMFRSHCWVLVCDFVIILCCGIDAIARYLTFQCDPAKNLNTSAGQKLMH